MSMLKYEALELRNFLDAVTGFGDELELEEVGGNTWAVIREVEGGTLTYVGETEGVFIAFYQQYDWEDGNDPTWTSLVEDSTEFED